MLCCDVDVAGLLCGAPINAESWQISCSLTAEVFCTAEHEGWTLLPHVMTRAFYRSLLVFLVTVRFPTPRCRNVRARRTRTWCGFHTASSRWFVGALHACGRRRCRQCVGDHREKFPAHVDAATGIPLCRRQGNVVGWAS